MAQLEVPDLDLDYTRYTNRQLATIPLVVLAVALLIIAVKFALVGVPVTPGLDFTGGTELTIQTNDSPDAVRQAIEAETPSGSAYDVDAVETGSGTVTLVFQATGDETIQVRELTSAADAAGYRVDSVQQTSPTFGGGAQQQAFIGVVAAFAGMAALVFVLFRTFVPSIAVVVSAFSDIVIPIALMNVFDIPLSLGTVAALLMLIGYSVDSDLLLNNHILRRRGGFYESTYRARRTGVTMTLTSIAAVTVMAIVSALLGVPLLPAIGIILAFGLVADLMNTYLLNVSLLRYYKYEGIAK